MEQLVAEVLEEMKIELEITDERDIAILQIKIKNAVREIKAAFNFKPYHKEDYILEQMENHLSNIKSLAMYDYMKIGAEGESAHSEKNISREYVDRSKCFAGIVPFAD